MYQAAPPAGATFIRLGSETSEPAYGLLAKPASTLPFCSALPMRFCARLTLVVSLMVSPFASRYFSVQ